MTREDIRAQMRVVLGSRATDAKLDLVIGIVAVGLGRMGGRPRQRAALETLITSYETPETGYSGFQGTLKTSVTGYQGFSGNPNTPSLPHTPSDPLSVSDLFSASGSGARDPSGTTQVAQHVERRKVYRAPAYPPEFESWWSKIGVGSKGDALKAWEQVGKPDGAVLIASWGSWSAVVWRDGIGVPHTATWLRRFDWQQTPAPRKAMKNGNGHAPPAAPTVCQFHLVISNAMVEAPKPATYCTECHLVAGKKGNA